jgi:hypothetical protein
MSVAGAEGLRSHEIGVSVNPSLSDGAKIIRVARLEHRRSRRHNKRFLRTRLRVTLSTGPSLGAAQTQQRCADPWCIGRTFEMCELHWPHVASELSSMYAKHGSLSHWVAS